jgi:hypothetical protein
MGMRLVAPPRDENRWLGFKILAGPLLSNAHPVA